jgi:hypothetical protein
MSGQTGSLCLVDRGRIALLAWRQRRGRRLPAWACAVLLGLDALARTFHLRGLARGDRR